MGLSSAVSIIPNGKELRVTALAPKIHPGRHLGNLLEYHGLSTEKVAGILKIPLPTFKALLAGARPMNFNDCRKIAVITNTDMYHWAEMSAQYECCRSAIACNPGLSKLKPLMDGPLIPVNNNYNR